MEPSISVQMIWYIAAQEAVSAHFEFIEPFHIINALLKFAEADDGEISASIPDKTAIHELLSERDQLRSLLAERGFEIPLATTKIRRTIRKRMGNGGCNEKKSGAMHRSTDTKVIFQKAEVLAQKDYKKRLTVLPLMTELLDNSEILSEDLLTEAGIQPKKSPKTTPVLDSCGKNLLISSVETGSGNSPADLIKIKNDPVIKVLIDGLKNHKKEHILLIQTGTRSGQEIMYSLASLINKRSKIDGIPDLKIIEINLKNISQMEGGKTPESLKEKVNALLNEASEKKNIVLYCSDFEDWFDPKQKYLSLMLTEYLKNGAFSCVCSLKASAYQEYSNKLPLLKQIFRLVWIHDIDSSFNFI
jgi:hypothetical protein